MRNMLTMVGLLIVAGLSFLLMRSLQDDLSPSSADDQVKVIATVYDVNARFFSADNRLAYRFQSPEMTQLSQEAGTTFLYPKVTVFDKDLQPQWLGRADKGHLSADQNRLAFSQKTRVKAYPETEETLEMQSEELIYSADSNKLSGQQLVKVTGQGMTQQANRYQVNLSTKQVFFFDQVQARYQANHKARVP